MKTQRTIDNNKSAFVFVILLLPEFHCSRKLISIFLGPSLSLASLADVLRGSSRFSASQTSAEPKDKFLSLCSQISDGDHIQIIGDPIGAVEVKVLTITHVQAR